MVKLILITFISILSFSCSLQSWWGESPPEEKIIDINKNAAKIRSPLVEDIILGDEAKSLEAISYFKKTIDYIWNDLEGDNKDIITEEELKTLVDKRIIKFSDNISDDLKKIMTIKSLLGIKSEIKKDEIYKLFNWVEINRISLKQTYHNFSSDDYIINFKDILKGVELSIELFNMIGWEKDIATIIRDVDILFNYKWTKKIETMTIFSFELIGFVCPSSPEKGIHLTKLSNCLRQLVDEFKGGSEWFDYQLDAEYNGHDPGKIIKSLDLVKAASKSWFKNPKLREINTSTIIDVLNAFDFPPTENLKKSFSLVEEFKGKSTRDKFYPDLFLEVLEIFFKDHQEIFKVMPYYIDAFNKKECLEKDIITWMDCSFSFEKTKELYKKNVDLKVYDIVEKIITPTYSKEVWPLNPKLLVNLLKLKSISMKIIKTFDHDKDGYLSSSNINEKNEVLNIIQKCLFSIDAITNFLDNLNLKEMKLKSYSILSPTLDGFDLEGISRLTTLVGGDLLVIREKKEKLFADKIYTYLTNVFPKGAVHLNEIELTSVMKLVDSFTDYRKGITNNEKFKLKLWIDPMTLDKYIERKSFFTALPQIMKKYFPISFESCNDLYWPATCHLSFDEILPDTSDLKDGYIEESNIDIIVLIASAIEGVVNTCDYDFSNTLSWSIFDGNDELDCAFSKISNITKKLMESKVINERSNETIKSILKLVDSTFLTRHVGKSALVTGSLSRPVTRAFDFLIKKSATIGSIYSLLAEILNTQRSYKLLKIMKKQKLTQSRQ